LKKGRKLYLKGMIHFQWFVAKMKEKGTGHARENQGKPGEILQKGPALGEQGLWCGS